jgi:hypothetical protein
MKLMIFLIVGGICMMIYGCNLRNVSKGASENPTKITLSKLEKEGFQQGSNRHIKITQEHFQLFDLMAFENPDQNTYQKKAFAFPYPGHTYTPIVSGDHSIVAKIAKSYTSKDLDVPFHAKKAAKKGSVWMRYQIGRYKIKYPQLKKFRILIKDVRYKTTDEVPVFMLGANSIAGMVLDNDSFSGRDREIIEAAFPSLDINEQLIIVETGRIPDKPSFYNTLIYLGLASWIFGIFHAGKMMKPEKTSGAFENEDELTAYAKKRNPHLFN